MKKSRPTVDGLDGCSVTTPSAAAMILLFGSSITHKSVALSKDQYRALQRMYGYVDEKPSPSQRLMQAGSDRNMCREADEDGMRLVAWIAKYVGQEEDPLKVLIRMAVDAGMDVSPSDIEWAEGET